MDQGGIARWLTVTPDLRGRLGSAIATLSPHPVPASFDVVVNHHSVARTAGYLRLFSVGTPVRVWPRSIVWLPVRIFSSPSSPWGDGANSLWISKRGGYLMRDRTVVKISAALARRILARRPLNS